MKNKPFVKTISDFGKNIDEDVLAVVREATKELITDAQSNDKSSGTGAYMPVDTGFLRSSGLARLNTPPSGPIKGRDRAENEAGVIYSSYQSGDDAMLVLAKMKKGDVFYFGWTAVYAYFQDLRHGFMSVPVSNWQKYVKKAVERLENARR